MYNNIMDCERLISLIQERSSLWNVKDEQYHNRDVSRKLWADVAKELNSTSGNVKTKWQHLRDTFRREMAKTNQPTGLGYQGECKWRYFQQMRFLEEIYVSRNNVSHLAEVCETTSDIEAVSEDKSEEKQQDADGSARSPTPEPPKKRPKKVTDPIQQLIQLEKDKIAHLKESISHTHRNIVEDEDYFFLLSLLPHLRSVPKHKKLMTRIKLQQVVLENQDST